MAEQLANLQRDGEPELNKLFDTSLASGTWSGYVMFSNTNIGGIGVPSFGAPNILKRKNVTITNISGSDIYSYAYGDGSGNAYINVPFSGDKLWGFCASTAALGSARYVTVTYTVD